MKSNRSVLLGLVVSVGMFAACEDKTDIVIPPEDIVLNASPESITMAEGETRQIVASVTGGESDADRNANFSSTNTSVATVSPATGTSTTVTAVSVGNAQIIVQSVEDPSKQDIVDVEVTPEGGAPPTISIQRITTFVAGVGDVDAAINNINGQITITANLEVPEGTAINRVEFLLDNTVVCSQDFTTAGADVDAAAAPIACSINTAEFNATSGDVVFPNGPHTLKVQVIGPQGTVVAQSTGTQFSTLLFNNPNFIVATVTTSRGTAIAGNGPRSLAPNLNWNAGAVSVALLPIIFDGATNELASATVTLTSSGMGVNGTTACDPTNNLATDPTISSDEGGAGAAGFPGCPVVTASRTVTGTAQNVFTATFPETSTMNASSAGVQNVEDILTVAITGTITTGGQPGTVCVNPDPVNNPFPACAGQFFPNANPLRLDNLAPRVTQLNIVRLNQYFNASFTPSHAIGAAACTAPCARTVDYGVDRQNETGNAVFLAGTSTSALVDVTAGFGPLPETVTANTNLFGVRVEDALDNQRTVFATGTATIVSNSATGALLFGIDNTAPTMTVVALPADNSTNPGMPFAASVTFSDAGVGPSGFLTNPARVKIERVTATGTVCIHPDTGATVSCSNPVADDGNFTIPAVDGYYTITVSVTDAAGNTSTSVTRLTLHDATAPTFTGGISTPVNITGGDPVSFTTALADNVELGSLIPYVGYGAAAIHLAWPLQEIGAYGPDPLTTTDAGNVTIPLFIRSVEGNTGAGLPNGTIANATTMNYEVRDEAGDQLRFVVSPWMAAPNDGLCPAAGTVASTQNCTTNNVSIDGLIADVTTSAWGSLTTANGANALHGLFTMPAPSAAQVCNNAAKTSCSPSSTPTTTTLTATVTGPAGTFTSPFAEVRFYYQDDTGKLIYIGSAAGSSITDESVTSTRTVTYTVVWDASTPKVRPAGDPGTAFTVVAIARNANGDALMSTTAAVTVEGN